MSHQQTTLYNESKQEAEAEFDFHTPQESVISDAPVDPCKHLKGDFRNELRERDGVEEYDISICNECNQEVE